MKKSMIVMIIDGIIRAVILWGTLLLLYSQFLKISLWYFVIFGGIILSFASMIVTFRTCKQFFIFSISISIPIFIIVSFLLSKLSYYIPMEYGVLMPGDRVTIFLYRVGYMVLNIFLQLVFLFFSAILLAKSGKTK